MKEKLKELLKVRKNEYLSGQGSPNFEENLADYLLANGVIVPPCKVGDTVWVCNQTAGKVFKNTVIGLYVCGKSKFKNSIKCEYRNVLGEISHRKFTFAQVGKNIFFTREEAEAALKGVNYESSKVEHK